MCVFIFFFLDGAVICVWRPQGEALGGAAGLFAGSPGSRSEGRRGEGGGTAESLRVPWRRWARSSPVSECPHSRPVVRRGPSRRCSPQGLPRPASGALPRCRVGSGCGLDAAVLRQKVKGAWGPARGRARRPRGHQGAGAALSRARRGWSPPLSPCAEMRVSRSFVISLHRPSFVSFQR